MIRALPHILARVFNVPLLIAPARAQALVSGLGAAMLARGSAIEPALAFDKDPEDKPQEQPQRLRGYRIDRGVATLPVRGVLVRRAGQIAPDSTELQSYEGIRRSLRAARGDPRVRGILLELDTPGGEAGGIFEMANEVAAVASDKPIWAIANDDALSAGYTIAAPAQRLWITDTGAAGSIGVVALHLDQSGFDEQEGFRYSYVYKGAHKIDANPHAPLTPAAVGAIQGEVDRLYDMLIETVAGHRKASPDRLRATEAQIYFGDRAVREGLADQLGTLDQAHAAMAEHVAPQRRTVAAQTTRRTVRMEEIETASPEPIENVVPLSAVTDARAQAGEIAALCALAGYPELAAEQIRASASVEAVRALLLTRKAADDAKRQVEAIDTSATRPGAATVGEINKFAESRFTAQRTGHA